MNKDNAFWYSQIFQSSQCVPSCVTYQTFIGCPDLSGRCPVASRRLDRIIVGHLPYWVSTEFLCRILKGCWVESFLMIYNRHTGSNSTEGSKDGLSFLATECVAIISSISYHLLQNSQANQPRERSCDYHSKEEHLERNEIQKIV